MFTMLIPYANNLDFQLMFNLNRKYFQNRYSISRIRRADQKTIVSSLQLGQHLRNSIKR